MKIAIDISQVAYEGTGVANYTSNFVKNLLKYDNNNDYLLFGFSLRNRKSLNEFYEQIKDLNPHLRVKFIMIPQSLGNILWNRFHLGRLEMLTGPIDIYHSSDWIQLPAQAKKITTVHDLVIVKYPEYSHPYIVKTQRQRLVWVKKECDLVMSDSLSTKNDLTQLLHFDAGKIEVVYPGIGEEYKPSSEEEKIRVRQKYGLFDDYILTVGTLEPRKNLKAAVAAFGRFLLHPLVASKEKPIELVVVGKTGWGKAAKTDRFIHQLGYIDQRDLPALYSGATLFIYPSLYEGFGLPVIEAMACGCPVITSDRGSLGEIAQNSAVFADPEKEEDIAVKMTKLFIDNELRKTYIIKGQENAANFRWEKVVDKIIKLYEKINSNASPN